MAASGFTTDCVIYNTSLNGCVRHSRWKLFESLLKEMDDKGIVPSNFTTSITVKMWAKRRQLEKAIAVVYDLVQSPLRPPVVARRLGQATHVDVGVGNCLIDACVYNMEVRRALEIFRDMENWPGFDGPNSHTYRSLICGLVSARMIHEAVEVAEESLTKLVMNSRANVVDQSTLRQLFCGIKSEGLSDKLGSPLCAKLAAAGLIGRALVGSMMSSSPGARTPAFLRSSHPSDQFCALLRANAHRRFAAVMFSRI